MNSGIFDTNQVEVKIGSIVSFPYITPKGEVTEEEDFTKKIEFKYGCFGYYNELRFVPLMDWMKTDRGEYIPNCGNKTIYTNKYYFTIKKN